jgi:hypothetical protein
MFPKGLMSDEVKYRSQFDRTNSQSAAGMQAGTHHIIHLFTLPFYLTIAVTACLMKMCCCWCFMFVYVKLWERRGHGMSQGHHPHIPLVTPGSCKMRMRMFYTERDTWFPTGRYPSGILADDRKRKYESVFKSFRTDRLERELQWYSCLPLGEVVSIFCESV